MERKIVSARIAYRDYEEPQPFEARPTRSRTIIAILGGIALAGVAVAWLSGAAWSRDRIDNAVVFVADISDSMGNDEVEIVRNSHAMAIQSREVLDAIASGGTGRSAFAYVEFADTARVVVGWTIVDGPESAAAFASSILADQQRLGTNTAIGVGLATAETLLRELPYDADFMTVDVVGDGKANHGVGVVVPRGMILAMGATINGLPMSFKSGDPHLSDYYEHQIIGGPRAFLLDLRSIEDMPMMMRRKLIMEIGSLF